MFINDYHEAIDTLKEAYENHTTLVILDLNESLDPQDIVYAWRRCSECGNEILATLGEVAPRQCLCGCQKLVGHTAFLVIQGAAVLYNYNRDNHEWGWESFQPG